jgi:hypothetical protein
MRARAMTESAASAVGVFPARSPVVLMVLAVPFLVLGIQVLWGLRRFDPWLVLLCGTAAATILGALLLGMSARRYLLFLAPLSALAIVRASASPETGRWRVVKRAAVLAVLLLMGAGSIRLLLLPRLTPIGDLTAFLRAEARPTDLLLFHAAYGEVPFSYYAARNGVNLSRSGFPEPTAEWWARQSFKGWGSPVANLRELDDAVSGLHQLARRDRAVWLILFEPGMVDPRGLVQRRLESEFAVTERWVSADSAWSAVRLQIAGARVR